MIIINSSSLLRLVFNEERKRRIDPFSSVSERNNLFPIKKQ
jgi:hypothetical protein